MVYENPDGRTISQAGMAMRRMFVQVESCSAHKDFLTPTNNMTIDNLINTLISYLSDKEFTEDELKALLRQMLEQHGENKACLALAQFTERLHEFKERRKKRLVEECINYIIPELNEARNVTRLQRAQVVYKKNRRDKNAKQYPK
jgi:hypothetical protein